MTTLAKVREAFEALIEDDAEQDDIDLFNARMRWVGDAIGDLGISDTDECPADTLKALVQASIRLVGIDDVLEDEDDDDGMPTPKPAPKRKRPRVQTPKDNPWPRKRGAPKRVVHADAEPTEKQLEMLKKLVHQHGLAEFRLACDEVGIMRSLRTPNQWKKWNRLQASRVIKELLARA